MTRTTRDLLAAFMQDPTGEHYGLALAEATRLSSGTLYPILARLEAAGLLSSRWEEISESEEGRPRRRYYRLTGDGAEVAASAAAEVRTRAKLVLGRAQLIREGQ
jgi:PadR family transcriptional regulator PadR